MALAFIAISRRYSFEVERISCTYMSRMLVNAKGDGVALA